jgi:hypothetical protein
MRDSKVAYIQNPSTDKSCPRLLMIVKQLLNVPKKQLLNGNKQKKCHLLFSDEGENFHKVRRLHMHMKAPIYIYYKLDKFYQNHRR